MTFRIQKTAVRSTEEVGPGFPHDPAAGTPGDPEFRSSRGSWDAGDDTIPTPDPLMVICYIHEWLIDVNVGSYPLNVDNGLNMD